MSKSVLEFQRTLAGSRSQKMHNFTKLGGDRTGPLDRFIRSSAKDNTKNGVFDEFFTRLDFKLLTDEILG